MNIFNRLKILIIVGCILLILLVLIFISFSVNESTPSPVASTPPKMEQVSPQTSPPVIDFQKPFEVIAPQISNQQKLLINEGVTFSFSVPVNMEDVVISVEPPTVIRIDLDSTRTSLKISPESFWRPNTKYVIKILPDTKSLSNKNLIQAAEVEFQTQELSGM